jgi:hypothetical protein
MKSIQKPEQPAAGSAAQKFTIIINMGAYKLGKVFEARLWY